MAEFIKNKSKDGFSAIVIIVAVAALALILGGGWYVKEKLTKQVLEKKACTEEAKLCPDGSAVGRTGPKCEFAECPNVAATSTADISTWKTYRNEKYGFEVKYPQGYSPEEISDPQGNLSVTFSGKGHFSAHIINRKFDPNDIEGLYGKIDNPKKIIIGGQIGYRFAVGDAGCGGPVIQTGLREKVFEVNFGGCEGDQYNTGNDEILIRQVLSTFKFITSSATATGTLAGKISIGPICPVERIPPMPGCMPTPEAYAAHEFLVLSSDQKKTVASFHADASGNYSVSLPAGNYVMVSAKTGVGYLSKNLPSTITIQAGKTVTLDISIDTGIR